jgi:pimeloyl-ACP methyl ester carboxylesterase
VVNKRKVVGIAALGAVAAALAFGARHTRSTPPVIAKLEHTPAHRGGTGSPLLLLHGVSVTWRAWSPVLDLLEPHHDVLAPTLLGHAGGGDFDPGADLSVAALADGIEQELDRAGFDTVHIAGNSLGGWIAIELARRGRAKSLVLFSPAGASRTQRRLEVLATLMRASITGFARYADRAEAIASRRALRTLLLSTQVAHPARVSPDYVAASLRAFALAPVVGQLLEALSHEQVRPLSGGQCFPIRLVWPYRDMVLPFRDFGAPMVARIPDAELVRIRGVGHVPMSDDPATVAKLILEVTTAADAAVSVERQNR